MIFKYFKKINTDYRVCHLLMITPLILIIVSCSEINNKALSHQVNHVVIIGVDAMSPDGIRNADTPVMNELMKNGAFTLNARGVLPTSSSTNWAS